MKCAIGAFALVVVLLFGTGCATQAVWQEGQFSRFHQPAKPSNLQVFEGKDSTKILVVYDEETDESDRRWRRGYWAPLDAAPPENPFRPRFVARKAAKGLRRVPISGAPGERELSVVTTNETQAFTLYRDGLEVWLYKLPVYEDASGRAKQVALTPVAVLADLTIVGGYLFLLAWSGGFNLD